MRQAAVILRPLGIGELAWRNGRATRCRTLCNAFVVAAFRVDFFFYVLTFIFVVQLLARLWSTALAEVFALVTSAFVGEHATVRIELTSRRPASALAAAA